MSNKLVKVLQAGDQVFPQTVAESVLVKNGTVLTLDKVLQKKIEQIDTPKGSGLVTSKDGTIITLKHQNIITPNESAEAKLIQYDSNGHIILTSDVNKHIVTVNEALYTEYNGNKEIVTAFGDDFKIDDQGNIALNWNNQN